MKRHDPTVSLDEASTQVAAPIRVIAGDAGDRPQGELLCRLLLRPELARDRSFVIQEAVDEFQRLSVANPTLTPDQYCRRFDGLKASLKSSICRQLEVEQFINSHSWLKEKLDQEPWPSPGQSRGSFHVIEEVGRGALSRAFLCSQPQLGNRQVIVKMSGSSLCEADSLGRLRHPVIVPIHSVEKDDKSGLHMLCMPFLGRSTLYDLFDTTREPAATPLEALLRAARAWEQPSDRIDIARSPAGLPKLPAMHHLFAWVGAQLASALAHAHAHGVFHGDVKPSNVLLTRDGSPLLMDFNLSGNLALSLAAKGGTLPYMPPEQLRIVALADGSAAQYDQRSDIYSLGAMLYEALTGRTPFPVGNDRLDRSQIAERLLELQQSGPMPIRRQARHVSPRLAALIETCLQFHPCDRIQQAGELAAALEAETQFYSRVRWRLSSNRKAVSACGLALLTLLLGSGFVIAQRPPRHERYLLDAIEHREAGRHIAAEDALHEALRISPSYVDAQFEMARTALAQKSYRAAHEALTRLEEMAPDARSAAYTGYYFNREQRHGAAIPWYLLAIERGADEPEILNNLGYSYMHESDVLSKEKAREAAFDCLRSALARTPNSPSVLLNWIRLTIERNLQDHVAIPENVPAACSRLASSKPNCGYCLDRAAAAVALAAQEKPLLCDQGIAYLKQAIELGHGPDARSLRSAPQWSAYRKAGRLGPIFEMLERGRKSRAGDHVSPIIEPVSLAYRGMAK